MRTRRLVVGTAGHIDHGKSSLVRALTGVDPDRLKEEKARGITIELGFAPLTLPSGERLSFVDVPGHERLIRTMVAGATGIDWVLLVIASDEGVMPQTREHLDILRLLGVEHGIIVLTKCDQVDAELLELATLDVRELLADSPLADAPLVACSSVTREGLDRLVEALSLLASRGIERSMAGPFRLPIDRVFTLRGFGTVVTGTVASGLLRVGETLELLPTQARVKVRGLQVHGQDVQEVGAGNRAAINLQGIEKDAVERGFQLVSPGQLVVTSLLDVSYHQLERAGKGLEHRARVRFLSGTSEVNGVAHLLGADAEGQPKTELEPGEQGFLQLRLDEPVPARAGDAFILRLESPLVTLGGGRVLDVQPEKHRREGRLAAVGWLSCLASEGLEARLRVFLERVGPSGAKAELLARRAGVSLEAVLAGFIQLNHAGQAVLLEPDGREAVLTPHFRACSQALLARIEALHRQYPRRQGLPRGELLVGLPYFGDKVIQRALEGLVEAREVEVTGPLYARFGFEVVLEPTVQGVYDRLGGMLREAGCAPPLQSELQAALGVSEELLVELLMLLAGRNQVVKLKEGHWVWKEALDALHAQVVGYLRAQGELSPSAFKELTGLSRKWAIPLLEYLDRAQVTVRVGDSRRLRGAGSGG